ncbi:hypothetical protein LshimejAT787_1204260 [Lyophyllum shimeji]|uniref:Extracellular serine-rich protein n=1 Tax=Lyophyllum shimeji TaxID=47721 RepID=A0A9P3PXB7_LYOSH|nr:hypothetical protein LshimejAT787_1204260 [Lyophyllum shimeji]
MRLLAAIIAFSVPLLAVAQNNPVILVGSTSDAPGGIFQFLPPSINATNGTTITFRFTGAPGNHSVTQSTFSDPCNPMPGGFDSGWVFIPPNNVSTAPEWNLTITNTSTPLWFFCKQLVPLTHCSAGMVGAINAPASGNLTFDNYKSNAQKFQGPSGQGEGSLVGHGASASSGPGPSVSGAQFFTASPVSSASGSASGTAPPSPSRTNAPNAAVGLLASASSVCTLVIALGVAAGAVLSVA